MKFTFKNILNIALGISLCVLLCSCGERDNNTLKDTARGVALDMTYGSGNASAPSGTYNGTGTNNGQNIAETYDEMYDTGFDGLHENVNTNEGHADGGIY